MEAYSNLVQDTKNGRLKFLLNETDSYISTINRMIQEQRVLTVEEVCVELIDFPKNMLPFLMLSHYQHTVSCHFSFSFF